MKNININYILTITDYRNGKVYTITNNNLDHLKELKKTYIQKGFIVTLGLKNNYQERQLQRA